VHAFESYLCDKVKGNELIGILPERRIDLGRINRESIMKWVRLVLGDHADMNNIFSLKITVGKTEVRRRDLVLERRTKRNRRLK